MGEGGFWKYLVKTLGSGSTACAELGLATCAGHGLATCAARPEAANPSLKRKTGNSAAVKGRSLKDH
jgi:pyridoxine 5'-phosphate synthase PdxJ